MPMAGPQSQATELTAHKTGESRPRLPEGTRDMWGHGENNTGLWAAQGTCDGSSGSISMMWNTIRCLLLFTWTIQIPLEAAVPRSALPADAFQGARTVTLGGLQGPHCGHVPVALNPGAPFFLLKTLFPPSFLFFCGGGVGGGGVVLSL